MTNLSKSGVSGLVTRKMWHIIVLCSAYMLLSVHVHVDTIQLRYKTGICIRHEFYNVSYIIITRKASKVSSKCVTTALVSRPSMY